MLYIIESALSIITLLIWCPQYMALSSGHRHAYMNIHTMNKHDEFLTCIYKCSSTDSNTIGISVTMCEL